jgi:putative oxidoreductase
MNQVRINELTATLLRASLGLMYLTHGLVLKILTFGLAGTAGYFVSIGLPAWLGYATAIGETIGGVLLLLGVQTRLVALALSPALLGAIIWVHGRNGWVFSAPGGGWEYPAFLLVVSVAVAALGSGAYALQRPATRPGL